jgi:hypothetical protein
MLIVFFFSFFDSVFMFIVDHHILVLSWLAFKSSPCLCVLILSIMSSTSFATNIFYFLHTTWRESYYLLMKYQTAPGGTWNMDLVMEEWDQSLGGEGQLLDIMWEELDISGCSTSRWMDAAAVRLKKEGILACCITSYIFGWPCQPMLNLLLVLKNGSQN